MIYKETYGPGVEIELPDTEGPTSKTLLEVVDGFLTDPNILIGKDISQTNVISLDGTTVKTSDVLSSKLDTVALPAALVGKDASQMVATPVAGESSFPLVNIISAELTPEFFGAVGNWNGSTGTNNFAAFQRAFLAMKALGRPLVIRNSAAYRIAGSLDFTDADFALYGYGYNIARLVFDAAGPGMTINQVNYKFATHIEGVSISTIRQEPGVGLSITYAPGDSYINRSYGRCIVQDVEVRGENDLNHGWLDGVVMNDTHLARLRGLMITGRKNDGATPDRNVYNRMRYGLSIVGAPGGIPSDIDVSNPEITRGQIGINLAGAMEGILISKPTLVAVETGVRGRMVSQRPWVQIESGHINCFDYGVDLQNCPQSTIDKLLIYKFQNTDGPTTGVKLDACSYSSVTRLRLMNQAADATANGDWHGVVANDTSYTNISDIDHERPSKTVQITGNSSEVITEKLRPVGGFTGATQVTYSDTSTGNNRHYGAGRKVMSGESVSAVSVGSGGADPLQHSFAQPVAKGERYRIKVQVSLLKGGVTGDTLVSLRKISGTASVSFIHSDTALRARVSQSANTSIVIAVEGEMIVTASGTLTVGPLVQSLNSNADILAGGAQMSILLA